MIRIMPIISRTLPAALLLIKEPTTITKSATPRVNLAAIEIHTDTEEIKKVFEISGILKIIPIINDENEEGLEEQQKFDNEDKAI